MKVQNSVDIDELYERVEGFDLVLTVDAPLADALNNRIKEPRIGKLAKTPRNLVFDRYQNEKVLKKRDLFVEVVRRTGMGWKKASYLLENLVDCWRHTGDLEEIMAHDRFETGALEEIMEVIRDTRNIYMEMERFQPDEDLDVAVIGLYQFDEMDRKVLPEDFEEIEVFGDGEEELPEFKVFSSSTSLVSSVVDNIESLDPNDVAVVVDPGSRYDALVQSSLDSREIPYLETRDFREMEELRNFVQMLRASMERNDLKLKDVQHLLQRQGIHVSVKHNQEYIEKLDIEELEELKDLLRDIEGATFGEALEMYREEFGDIPLELEDNLEEVGIMEEQVSAEAINRLEYYLDTYDIEMERDSGGVLLVSPKNTAFVDKPVVFYLGMDSSWTREVSDREWVDRDREEDKGLSDFKVLLQNGENQYFMVQNTLMNQDVTPCFYFNEIQGEFERFTDAESERYGGREVEGERFEKLQVNCSSREIETISQSSLNNLVRCPRDYFFAELVDSADREYLRKGTLLHDFAEFCLNYTEFVEEKGIMDFVDIMVEEMEPIVESLELEEMRTEFIIALENIKQYIETGEIEESDLDGYERKYDENRFADEFDRDIESRITEMWFENKDIGARGKVDLIKTPQELVDYKSGYKKSTSKIVRHSNIDMLEQDKDLRSDPNFQAILYLAHHRSVNPGEKLSFTFFHFMDNIEDVIAGEGDQKDNLVTVTYYPRSFNDHIATEEAYDYLDSAKVRKKVLEPLGKEMFREVFGQLDVSKEAQYDRDKMVEEELERLCELCGSYLEVGRGKDVTENQLEKGCRSILKQLVYLRKQNYFKEDLDRFEEFLEDWLERLNEYRESRFPVGDNDLDRVNHRDLIVREVGT